MYATNGAATALLVNRSNAVLRGTPARSTITRASDREALSAWTTRFTPSLSAAPAPDGPQAIQRLASTPSTSCAVPTSAAAPPHMTVSVPSRAKPTLPDTGASTSDAPRRANLSWVAATAEGPTVLMSTHTVPGAIPASAPSGPDRTASRAISSASMLTTMVRPVTASRGVVAAVTRHTSARRVARSRAFASSLFQTTSSS